MIAMVVVRVLLIILILIVLAIIFVLAITPRSQWSLLFGMALLGVYYVYETVRDWILSWFR